jgi:hypothetical protein
MEHLLAAADTFEYIVGMSELLGYSGKVQAGLPVISRDSARSSLDVNLTGAIVIQFAAGDSNLFGVAKLQAAGKRTIIVRL